MNNSIVSRLARHAPEIGLALILSAVLASSAVALSSDRAPTSSAQAPSEPMADLSGPDRSQQLQAESATKTAASRGRPLTVGVMTYSTKDGLLCLAAGPTRNGHVGRMGPRGFRALEASEAPASCGDIRQNLADFGGIALAHSSASETDLKVGQAIVYGIVADASTTIRVVWPDGTTEQAAAAKTASGAAEHGAAGAFVIAAPIGQDAIGARVDLVRPDESVSHSFKF